MKLKPKFFLNEIFNSIKAIADKALLNSEQALAASIDASQNASAALTTATEALEKSNYAVTTADQALYLATVAKATSEDAKAKAIECCEAAEAAESSAAISAEAARQSAQDAETTRIMAEYHEIATRIFTGSWVITGLTPQKPLFIVTFASSYPDNEITSPIGGGPIYMYWPISDSITIDIPSIAAGTILKAYQ